MNKHKLIRSGVANDPSALRPTVQHCLEATLSLADSMIDELLEGLLTLADPQRVVPIPVELKEVDSAEIVRWVEQADDIKLTWSATLREVFYNGAGGEVDMPLVVRFDDLRLLDDAQIDASIEFAMLEHILASASEDMLPRLNAQVSNLMGWLTVQADLNPVKPAAYARALRTVMFAHLPDPQQRKLLAIPMANLLGQSLRQVYRELIQWLIAHGVQPLERSLHALAGPDKPPSSAVGRTMLTLGRLRQLLVGDLNGSPAGGPVSLQTVPASMTALEDMDLIEPLMKRLRERPVPSTARPLAAALPVVSGHNLGRLLGQEVVRLMLENITRDERLLPAIRQQIGLLEPSLIRLSQAEPRFFSDRQHPARHLIESITQRSLGFVSPRDEGFADLLKSVRGAVKSLDQVDASEEKYARLLKRLRRRWEEDDARKNTRRAEAARALLHAEQRQQLAERLVTDFQQRLHDKVVPEFVQRFVCGPWAQALAEVQLGGEVGEGEALDALTDDLIWSAQSLLIRRDADRLARLVPRLLPQIRQVLLRIGYQEALISPFFDALVQWHAQAFDTPLPVEDTDPVCIDEADFDPEDAMKRVSAFAVLSNAASGTFWMADQEASDAGFLVEDSADVDSTTVEGTAARELELTTGAWVNLRAQGEWVRAQLTWTSPRGGLYMFISASGMAHSMTRRTLDRLLGAGALQIVSRGGVVASALDAVAQQALRNAHTDHTGGDNDHDNVSGFRRSLH
ncbi:MAG: DUF1631 family protein [Hydrogenophaga sp.]